MYSHPRRHIFYIMIILIPIFVRSFVRRLFFTKREKFFRSLVRDSILCCYCCWSLKRFSWTWPTSKFKSDNWEERDRERGAGHTQQTCIKYTNLKTIWEPIILPLTNNYLLWNKIYWLRGGQKFHSNILFVKSISYK